MVVSAIFPSLSINGQKLNFITLFKHLGHIINSKLNDSDIKCEMRNLRLVIVNLLNVYLLFCKNVQCSMTKIVIVAQWK